MTIFVVWFLQVSCRKLIQPVEVYTNGYMMWYQKSYVLQRIYLSVLLHHLSNSLSIIHFLVCLAVVRCPADTFHVELVCAFARISYAREILRSCARLYLAIACTIIRTIFLVGPGFEPLALHAIFFVGPGFDSLAGLLVLGP